MPQEEPLMYDLGPHSVNLRWRPAEIPSYLNDGSPITYTIYALEPPGTSWQPIVRRIPHNFYHLANIRPEQEYHFRVQAENRYGVSRPTLPVKLPKMAGRYIVMYVYNLAILIFFPKNYSDILYFLTKMFLFFLVLIGQFFFI